MSAAGLAKIALSEILRRARAAAETNERAVAAAYREQVDEIVFELQQAARRRPAAAELDEREARALFDRVFAEALHATTRGRMRLLAHAVAGVFAPDLDADMRSRVSRAVTQLEPSDVVLLRNLARMAGVTPSPASRIEVEALQAAGCLISRTESEDVGRALHREMRNSRGNVAGARVRTREVFSVTQLGHAVLAALGTWEPDDAA